MPNKLIHVETLGGQWNGRRTIFFQCDHVSMDSFPGGFSSAFLHRCGGDAGTLVIQEGELTGRRFNLRLCSRHAQPYWDAWAEKLDEEGRLE